MCPERRAGSGFVLRLRSAEGLENVGAMENVVPGVAHHGVRVALFICRAVAYALSV